MIKQRYAVPEAAVLCDTLPNGLEIRILPKGGFHSASVCFAVNYGGMDHQRRQNGARITDPAGIAHFLEHQLFETENGSGLSALSARGASVNAFTSASMTAYYFECIDHPEEHLRTLLSFVSVPHFTEESVEQERGIIRQEIAMVEDDPSRVVYQNLLQALYRRHPIRDPIVGTEESIRSITPELLRLCHSAYYHAGNMVLTAAGNIDPHMVADLARQCINTPPRRSFPRHRTATEPDTVNRAECACSMAVSRPLFAVGCKLTPPRSGILRRRLTAELSVDLLCGPSSPLYESLYRQGLIDSSFTCGAVLEPGAAFLAMTGESPDPRAVLRLIREEGAALTGSQLDPERIETARRSLLGQYIQGLDSLTGCCTELAQCRFGGDEFLDFPTILNSVTPQEIADLLSEAFSPDHCALSLITPLT